MHVVIEEKQIALNSSSYNLSPESRHKNHNKYFYCDVEAIQILNSAFILLIRTYQFLDIKFKLK